MRHTALAILILSMVPAVGMAQDSNDGWNAIQHMTEGRQVTVTVGGGKLISGTFLRASGNTLLVQRDTTAMTLDRSAVREIKVLDPAKRKRNMLLFGAIGAVAGAAPGAMWDTYLNNETGNGGMTAPLLGALGAGIGILATRHSGYTTTYFAPKTTSLLRSINVAPVISKNQKGAALSLSF